MALKRFLFRRKGPPSMQGASCLLRIPKSFRILRIRSIWGAEPWSWKRICCRRPALRMPVSARIPPRLISWVISRPSMTLTVPTPYGCAASPWGTTAPFGPRWTTRRPRASLRRSPSAMRRLLTRNARRWFGCLGTGWMWTATGSWPCCAMTSGITTRNRPTPPARGIFHT